MVDLYELQKKIYKNKVNHNFNVTDIALEFCLMNGEMNEAFQAYRKQKSDLGEELADIAIYLLGISEILGINLEDEILKKIEINSKRVYKTENGIHIKTDD